MINDNSYLDKNGLILLLQDLSEKIRNKIGNSLTEDNRSKLATIGLIIDKLNDLNKTIEDNEEVVSAALNDLEKTKQDTIDSLHKLSADLILDGTTNKVYTSTEKSKLAGIADGAEVNVQPDWNAVEGDGVILNKPDIPTKVSDLENDVPYANTADLAIVATTGDYNDLENKPINISSFNNDVPYITQQDLLKAISPPLSYGGHDYVEIAGIKWATTNIGASDSSDPGLYFYWGETKGYEYEEIDPNNKPAYKFDPEISGGEYTKYNSTDNKTVLEEEDDAAYVNWGKFWRTPTKEDIEALVEATYIVLDNNSVILIDKTNSKNRLVFPHSSDKVMDSYGWTSTLYYFISTASGTFAPIDAYLPRKAFATIRPILDFGEHKYIDFGLPSGTLWAATNIGATSEEEFGDYYIYGGKDVKYPDIPSIDINSIPQNTISGNLEYDTASILWGKGWRIPEFADFNELVLYTTHELVTDYNNTGISGVLFTNANASMFIPNAGVVTWNSNTAVLEFIESTSGYMLANNGLYQSMLSYPVIVTSPYNANLMPPLPVPVNAPVYLSIRPVATSDGFTPTNFSKVAFTGNYNDLNNTPTNISAFNNDSGYLTLHLDLSNYATHQDVSLEIASLVNSAPTTLDTLNELAEALGNDPNFATTVASLIGVKYTKPTNGIPSTDLASDVQTSLGKANTALQSFTETDPTVPSHVKEITTSDISSWNNKSDFSGSYNDLSDKPTIPTIPTNVSTFTNDAGYLTSYTETDPTVPAWAKASTKPTYTYSEVGAADKQLIFGTNFSQAPIFPYIHILSSGDILILNKFGFGLGETVYLRYDFPAMEVLYNQKMVRIAGINSPALEGTPTAPTASSGTNTTQIATTEFVQSTVESRIADIPDPVKPDWNATPGSTAEILNKPTIPAAQIQSDWNLATTTSLDYIKNKPSIPVTDYDIYAANLLINASANYITEPEVKSVKINGSSTNSASSSNCVLLYDTTNECLKFIFN